MDDAILLVGSTVGVVVETRAEESEDAIDEIVEEADDAEEELFRV